MIANSHFTGRLIESLGVPANRIRTVYPGVDVGRFHPSVDGQSERKRLAPNGPMLLTVGRLQRRKGHDLVLQALATLIPIFGGIRYVIAGDGPERDRLERLAADLRLAEHVVFLGSPNDDRLPALFAACDVFLMPTRKDGDDVEGFGIVFLEAAASGKPAIGGRNGGVSEAILDGETGILVSGTDAAELAAAIRQLLESSERRRAMGAAGRQRTCSDFTWDRAAGAVESIQAELTSESSSA